MKLIIFYLSSMFIFSSVCFAADGSTESQVVRNMEIYVKSPTKENANKAIDSIPELFSDPMGPIYSDELMSILEEKIKNKDPIALRLAMRLVNIADGAFAEDLYIMLVDVISREPELFLSELNKVKEPRIVDGLVLNLGEMDYSNQCLMYSKRINTFQQVQNASLNRIKNTAISILNTELHKCTQ